MCDLCVRVLRDSRRREEGRVARLSYLLRLLLKLERHTTCFRLLYGLCSCLNVLSPPPLLAAAVLCVLYVCRDRKKIGGFEIKHQPRNALAVALALFLSIFD